MSFPKYEHYKDSGVEWLGEVPAHWNMVPLKHLAEFINGDAFKPSEWAEDGIPIIRIQNLNGGVDFNYCSGAVEERYLVHEGDLLFGWSGNRGTSFGPFLWEREGVYALNQHIFRVVPYSVAKGDLYWILKAVTAHVEDQAHGIIGMVHVTKGDLGAIKVPVPNEIEQKAIAEFLSCETTKLDALITEQRTLIDLLKEKRQAVISHAVTKGLDPRVPMKDSGVEWLGEVPAHWAIVRLASIFQQVAEDGVEDLPILSVSIHSGVSDKEMNEHEMDRNVTRSDDRSKYKRVLPGDLVYNMMRAWQGGFGSVTVEGMVSPAYVVARPTCEFVTEFIEQQLRTPNAVEEMRRHSQGVTDFRLRLYWEEFKTLQVVLPSIETQREIIGVMNEKTAHFDALTAEAQTTIALLQERRSALISAAVTGKIDVRQHATEAA